MLNLGKAFQETIRNLEILRDSQNPPNEDVVANLDKLYEQQIDLINAAINSATKRYQQAARGMRKAARETKKAIEDLAKLEQGIEKVAAAIAKVAKLLKSVV